MLHSIAWLAGIPIIAILVVVVMRRAKAVNAAIAQHFEEEASGVKDPYAQMAAALNVQQALDEELRRSREAKRLLSRQRKPSR